MSKTWSILSFAASLLVACSTMGTQSATLPVLPTATTVRVVQATPLPTAARQFQPIPTTQTAVTTLQGQGCAREPVQRTQHLVDATVNYPRRTAQVSQTVRYFNTDSAPLDDIVFAVEANRFPQVFTLDEASIDGAPAPAYELTGRRLTVTLSDPLPLGCAVTLGLRFHLTLPAVGDGIIGHSGYFGFTARQINLGHWLPTIAYRADGGWITHDVTVIGEQIVSEIADWDVTVRVPDTPLALKIAAPGTMNRPAANAWRFVLTGARDFALSMSTHFEMRSVEATNGTPVEVFTLDNTRVQTDQGLLDAADHAADVAARSLAMYSDVFSPYPHERLVVVEGDFPDGMEFSGLIFVGAGWFEQWPGTPQSYLTIITAHEVAHQWWYANIGSDQALAPWLDEALATYSEYIFYEEYYPELRDWWWQFRIYSFVPDTFVVTHPVDADVYQFDNLRAYINAVYLRGARMLRDLRELLGTEAFFDWLAAYAQAGTGRIVTPDDFWSFLSAEQLTQIAATRAYYFDGS
ncbi:MAG: M1 family metallopeptidase [Anaerolineae bacterium]|nr:M1 family metallopeptidase [Anaerolineae bacterium]